MAKENLIKGQIISRKDLLRVARLRKRPQKVIKVPKPDVTRFLSEGYNIAKELKNDIRLERQKENWQLFEDAVWLLLWKFGFSELNDLDKLSINVGNSSKSDDADKWVQVDVFGRADNNVFIIECKFSEAISKKSLEKVITKFTHYRNRIIAAVKKHYRDSNIKVSFIIATRNIEWSEPDENEAKRSKIYIWRNKDIDYLEELANLYNIIGDSAKYQLYAIMFGNQKIKMLEGQQVATIKGKAGQWTYYSFVATPEQLLRISHVQRRVGAYGSKGLQEISGSYQRMLKRSKLKAIDHFIEEGRFFPNSIIISFDRPPRFDLMSSQELPFQYGILTLPNRYGSAWIIDGQHRLYGYAKSTRSVSAPLPVIAFERLPVGEQAKLFVEINQNQTPVERNLLWDLAGDIFEDSEDKGQREDLTISRVVKLLNELNNSPLKEHIFIPSLGKRSSIKNVTMTTVCQSIKKNNLLSADMFARVKLDQRKLENYVADRMAAFFRSVQSLYPEDWQKGDAGYLRSNNGIASLFIILKQILKYFNLQDKQNLYIKSDTSDFETESSILLLSAIEYIQESPDRSSEFRRRRGTAGQSESALELCQKIKYEFEDFPLPRIKLPDLPKDREKAKLENIDQMIKDTEQCLREHILETLKELYGDAWYRKGIPGDVKKAIRKNLEEEFQKRPYRKNEITYDKRLDFTCIGHLKDIILYKDNWSKFESLFSKKSHVEKHFTDYIDLRNAYLAHPREVDTVVWYTGRGAIKWIRKCLKL